jgi:CRP-like cAMP-binding protein
MYRAPQTTNRTLSIVHAACRATAKGGFAFGAVPIPLVPGQKYRAGIELLRQGEIARDVWIIDEGAVKLVYFGEDGRELTVGVRLIGWILGSASVILGKPSPVAAVTMTPCYLQRLDAGTFLEMLDGHSTLSQWLHKMHSQEVFDQLVSLTEGSALSARQRLERLLAQFIERLEDDVQTTDIRVPLPLSHRDLAGLVGITPEHLSRLLRQLTDEGVIRRYKGSIIVTDPRKLLLPPV